MDVLLSMSKKENVFLPENESNTVTASYNAPSQTLSLV